MINAVMNDSFWNVARVEDEAWFKQQRAQVHAKYEGKDRCKTPSLSL